MSERTKPPDLTEVHGRAGGRTVPFPSQDTRVGGAIEDQSRANGVAAETAWSFSNQRVSAANLIEWWPFPIDALPPACRRLVTEGARARGIDPAFVGVPLLGALAGAIGNARRLRVKRSYTEPAILWTITVGASGAMKTPPLDDVLRPHRDRDHRLLEERRAAREQYERDLLEFEAAKRSFLKGRGAPPDSPGQPLCRAVLADDATVEALVARLADNPRGLLLGLDELAGWISGFDSYKRGSGDAPKYLSMHRAAPVKVDRKSGNRTTLYVPRAALSIVGTVQPRTLSRVIGEQHRENGLLARLFVVMPPAAYASWSEEDVSEETYRFYETVIGSLLDLEMHPNAEPVELTLTSMARERWREYHNRMMTRTADAEDEDLSAAFSKLRGGALRIALILTLAEAAERGNAKTLSQVDEWAMVAGITLADWFAHEAERVYCALAETPEDARMRHLVAVVQARGGRVTPRELSHGGPRRYRDNVEAATADLNRLVKADLGRWEETVPGPVGGRPSTVFVLASPGDVAAETADSARESEVSAAEPEEHASQRRTPALVRDPIGPAELNDFLSRLGLRGGLPGRGA